MSVADPDDVLIHRRDVVDTCNHIGMDGDVLSAEIDTGGFAAVSSRLWLVILLSCGILLSVVVTVRM